LSVRLAGCNARDFGFQHASCRAHPPGFAAKQIVTAHQIGEGRFGLNMVSGWNEGEYGMFNVRLLEHDERYEYTEQWITLVKPSISDAFDYEGEVVIVIGKGGRHIPVETANEHIVGYTLPFEQNVWPIPYLVQYVSTFCELKPGDAISTGTPGGVGAKRTPPLFMRVGDVIEVEVTGIGVLRNPVVAERGEGAA
jgi:2-keto-4-pentenoate hydratase/2-oxohepta-3-ene-1,7-dioic acid hydratase in catechol pathway